MAKVFIEGRRDGYSPEQCGRTMTVGELIAYLENFDEDAKIYLENDGGYTYGYIKRVASEKWRTKTKTRTSTQRTTTKPWNPKSS